MWGRGPQQDLRCWPRRESERGIVPGKLRKRDGGKAPYFWHASEGEEERCQARGHFPSRNCDAKFPFPCFFSFIRDHFKGARHYSSMPSSRNHSDTLFCAVFALPPQTARPSRIVELGQSVEMSVTLRP